MPDPFRVLLAEPDPEIREALQACFAERGWDVVACVTGGEALAFLAAGAPGIDVVLLPMQGGGIDGAAAVQGLRSGRATGDLPIVCTGADAPGCDAYVAGPWVERRVLAAIDAALVRRGRPSPGSGESDRGIPPEPGFPSP